MCFFKPYYQDKYRHYHVEFWDINGDADDSADDMGDDDGNEDDST